MLLSPLIDGELPGTESLAVRQHLRDCPRCQEEYDELLLTKRMLGSMSVVEPREGFEEELIRALREAPQPAGLRGRLEAWWHTTDYGTRVRAAAALAAVSLILLALSVRVSLQSGSNPDVRLMAGAAAATVPGPFAEADIGFAHETVHRPQPVIYHEPAGYPAAPGDSGLRPLAPWHTYQPVSSKP